MEKTEGSVTQGNTEEMLFTYSEKEKQQNEINKENAKLVFAPKFIPLYPSLMDNGLSRSEAIVYGFIDFYMENGTGRFYFTNEQLAKILHFSPDTISKSISTLKKYGILNTKLKRKADGGTIRFINQILSLEGAKKVLQLKKQPNELPKSGLRKNLSSEHEKTYANNNKINNNKIN